MTGHEAAIYEQLLAVRCQAGDAEAFTELVADYSPRVAYYLRKMARDAADDLLQEVWCDVWRNLGRLREPKAFRAWLYRIARDRVARHLRRRPAGWRDLPADLPEPGGEGEFTAEDAEAVHAGLDQLPDPQREILVLRFIEGMSYGQLAEVTGVPPGTVASRLHHAKLALRRALEEAGYV